MSQPDYTQLEQALFAAVREFKDASQSLLEQCGDIGVLVESCAARTRVRSAARACDIALAALRDTPIHQRYAELYAELLVCAIQDDHKGWDDAVARYARSADGLAYPPGETTRTAVSMYTADLIDALKRRDVEDIKADIMETIASYRAQAEAESHPVWK